MNLVVYLRDNLVGAWQIMLGRSEGLDRIDASLDGFWRSFALLVPVAPLVLLSLITQEQFLPQPEGGTPLRSALTVYAIALLVDWFSFPLVFAFLARPLGLGRQYATFIVARNWGSLIVTAMVAVVDAILLFDILPAALGPYILIVALGVSLRFAYVIARTTLMVSALMALPIVVLDYLLSLVIWSAFDRFT